MPPTIQPRTTPAAGARKIKIGVPRSAIATTQAITPTTAQRPHGNCLLSCGKI